MDEEKVEPGRIALWVSVVALSSISFMLILGSVVKAVDSRPHDAYLIVEQVYFESAELGDETYDLIVKAYVTNDGDRAADVRVSAFVKEVNTNIVFDSNTDDLGKMKGKTTKRADMNVEIDSKRKYIVEIIAYKDGKVTVRGSGTINLAMAGAGGEDYRTDLVDEPPEDSRGMDGAVSGLPFPALAVLLPTILIAALVIRRWKR